VGIYVVLTSMQTGLCHSTDSVQDILFYLTALQYLLFLKSGLCSHWGPTQPVQGRQSLTVEHLQTQICQTTVNIPFIFLQGQWIWTNLWKFNNEMRGLGSVQLNIKWEKTLEMLKCIPWYFILPCYKVLLW